MFLKGLLDLGNKTGKCNAKSTLVWTLDPYEMPFNNAEPS
jgi:hypothetical protein